ncbi:MAG: hypothetical protein AAGD14_05090 [Planctomycetota bacterium]
MNRTSASLALAFIFVAGLLVGQTTGEPVRIEKPDRVIVMQDQHPQELAELIVKVLKPEEPSPRVLREVYDKLQGAARAGDLRSALIVYRIAAEQQANKAKGGG